MEQNRHHAVFRYEQGSLTRVERQVVQEYPLRLEVNGRELATLIASPHQLNFLVAGFLRLQGFIQGLDDILSLGVCAEFGQARIRLRTDVPERLVPALTSGCGTGISFQLPAPSKNPADAAKDRARITPEQVFALMRDLARKAENYRAHGGIHSAAVGDGEQLLIYSEDLGRHNTLDRIAGEALFKNLDLEGKLLVTSGRISSEMVAKAMRLGIALIASRTSPPIWSSTWPRRPASHLSAMCVATPSRFTATRRHSQRPPDREALDHSYHSAAAKAAAQVCESNLNCKAPSPDGPAKSARLFHEYRRLCPNRRTFCATHFNLLFWHSTTSTVKSSGRGISDGTISPYHQLSRKRQAFLTNYLFQNKHLRYSGISTLMLSQKLMGWLSKNFVLQGLVVFQGRRHTSGYVEVLKKRRNAVGRTFCDAIDVGRPVISG